MNGDGKRTAGAIILGIILLLGAAAIGYMFNAFVGFAVLFIGAALLVVRVMQQRNPPRNPAA